MRSDLTSTPLLILASAVLAGCAREPDAGAVLRQTISRLEAKVVASDPGVSVADLLALSSAYEVASRPLDAGATLARAIAGGAGSGHGYRLGRLWEAAGRMDLAATAYKAVGTAEADLDAATLHRSDLASQDMEVRRRGVSVYLAVARSWPGSPQAREALLEALSRTGSTALSDLRAESEDLALAQFSGDGDFAQAILGAAGRMAERQQGDQALAQVRALLDSRIRDRAAAEILVRLGRHGEAADLWERCWREGGDPNDLYHAAQSLMQSDPPRSARMWLRAAEQVGGVPGLRPAALLAKAWWLDPTAMVDAADRLAAAWAGHRSELALLALYRARAGIGDPAIQMQEVIAGNPDVVDLEGLIDVARADARAGSVIADRGRVDDRAGWIMRLAAALAQDDAAALVKVAEALRDGGLLDGRIADRACDLVSHRILAHMREQNGLSPGMEAQVFAFIRTVAAVPQDPLVCRSVERMAAECLPPGQARDAVVSMTEDPIRRAWASEGHMELACLLQDPPAGIHPLRLLALRQEAWSRAMQDDRFHLDAVAIARPAADRPEWAVRWAEALIAIPAGVDRDQMPQVIATLAPVAAIPGAHQERALALIAILHLNAGRATEAHQVIAALTGPPDTWAPETRRIAAWAAAGISDQGQYEEILDAAARTGIGADMDLVFEMVRSTRENLTERAPGVVPWSVPRTWAPSLVERAEGRLRGHDSVRRAGMLVWLAQELDDGSTAFRPYPAAVLARAREIYADDRFGLEAVHCLELEWATRQGDVPAQDAAARALMAKEAVRKERVGEALRRWLEPRLATMPATTADAALLAVMKTGTADGVWAAGRLAERQRPRDPTAAAITIQRMVWWADRDSVAAFEAFQALASTEAAAGRSEIAAGACAQMAVHFNPDRIGRDRLLMAGGQAEDFQARPAGRTGPN